MQRRVAFLNGEDVWRDGRNALLRWARDQLLGQDPAQVAEVARRRSAAMAARVAVGRRRGTPAVHRRLEVSPEWHLVTGIGDRSNPHEIGIALHGTYGWPVIPGSTMTGAARAWALSDASGDPEVVERVFGPPPGAGAHRAGTVDVLDALPVGGPVRVRVDGVTPHVQPYYGQPSNGSVPPAEWHNPVPSTFLVISGGRFAIDLIGPSEDVDAAAAWCTGACTDLGVGAKTGAGYGYLSATPAVAADGSGGA
jgi:CRISPR-associated protein Cmr6